MNEILIVFKQKSATNRTQNRWERTLALTGPVNGPSIYFLLTSAHCTHCIYQRYSNFNYVFNVFCVSPVSQHHTQNWNLQICMATGQLCIRTNRHDYTQNAKQKYCVRWNVEWLSWRSASMPARWNVRTPESHHKCANNGMPLCLQLIYE